jgi:uncharacterized protein with PIN domain
VLLTRDRRLVLRRRAKRWILVDSERLDEQLTQVIRDLHISVEPKNWFGRCVRCNTPLAEIPPPLARSRVPPHVARTQDRFRHCPECDRIYWSATHVQRMLRRLRRLESER